jgi:hypothetical protein
LSSIPNPHYGTSGYGLGRYGNQPIENLPLGYYIALLTSQYRRSPKLNALLYAILVKLDDVSRVLVKLDTAIDIDDAVGAQLDQLGAIAGASRTVPFQPSGGVSPVLNDATYRIYIKSKIAQNQWDGTIDSLYGIWQTLFPGGQIIIADQQDMTAIIILSGSFTSIIQDMINNDMIVPRPEGVLYTYLYPVLPIFGADLDNAFIAGADLGHAA